MSEKIWGRVDSDGNVYVIESSGERLVGAFPDATAEEALAYFVRKYDDINTALVVLERRLSSGTAHNAKELRKSLTNIDALLEAGVGVGDFDALRTRAATATTKIEAVAAEAGVEAEQGKERIIAERTAIVEKIEALASRDLTNVNWKQTSASVDELFAAWQATQREHINVSKEQADALWKRFRNARSALDRARRAHFAQADASTKAVKTAKEQLIAKAEELSAQPVEKAVPAYRALVEDWKKAGRASKKVDDALWAKFKSAGDAIYTAKKVEDSVEDASYAGNLDVKKALLAEGQAILSMTDREQARALLSSLQKRWDAAGKVPRNAVKDMEAGMRKIEQAVKKLDDHAWDSSNPEKAARQEGLAGALNSKIAGLEKDLAAATAAKDTKRVAELTEAIATQKSWLAVLGQ